MKQKILETNNIKEMNQLLDLFESQYNVKFTQTHVNIDTKNTKWYTWVLFYE